MGKKAEDNLAVVLLIIFVLINMYWLFHPKEFNELSNEHPQFDRTRYDVY